MILSFIVRDCRIIIALPIFNMPKSQQYRLNTDEQESDPNNHAIRHPASTPSTVRLLFYSQIGGEYRHFFCRSVNLHVRQ